jgi:hypothetical protein
MFLNVWLCVIRASESYAFTGILEYFLRRYAFSSLLGRSSHKYSSVEEEENQFERLCARRQLYIWHLFRRPCGTFPSRRCGEHD